MLAGGAGERRKGPAVGTATDGCSPQPRADFLTFAQTQVPGTQRSRLFSLLEAHGNILCSPYLEESTIKLRRRGERHSRSKHRL